MAGTVFSEMQGILVRGDGRKNEWSQAEIDKHLTKACGEKAQVVAEFQKAFPRKKVQDVLYFANGSRPNVKQMLAWKLEKSKTPVGTSTLLSNTLLSAPYVFSNRVTSGSATCIAIYKTIH
jgi:hypothetical protein